MKNIILVFLTLFLINNTSIAYTKSTNYNSDIEGCEKSLLSEGFNDFSEQGLRNILKQSNKSVAHFHALRLIGLKKYKKSIPFLVEYFNSCIEPGADVLKRQAAVSLHQLGDSKGNKFLRQLLDENRNQGDIYHAIDTVGALVDIGDDHCINVLQELMKSDVYSYRLAGIRHAMKLVGFGKGETLLSEAQRLATFDPNDLVKKEAAELVDEISILQKYYKDYVDKKEISGDKALKIAERECEKADWEWNNVILIRRADRFIIKTNKSRRGGNAYISIDKKTGKVLEKEYHNR